MFALRCNDSFNFEANFPIHPNVQEKMDYWKTYQNSNPINVVFIGIDTVSRSHAYRSIPETLKYMKEMGFHDFQGYHSIGPSTLPNFMAILFGLKRTEVRETCTSSWTSPFDSCPFIWKNFSLNNYITMYIEDGKETSFNWGGQSGFKNKPTDYYIHPLFSAIEDLRIQNFKVLDTTIQLIIIITSKDSI